MRSPAATAARIRSTATAMSPSVCGSWAGGSEARNPLAASGSSRPRRTSAVAVVSLTPSSSASASTRLQSHGRVVQRPSCIAARRYGRDRTASHTTRCARNAKIVNNQCIIYNAAMLASATRRDEVADALREAILDGRLAPGDRLVEDRVMEWLGATRSGARKAFRRLEHEGLLISYPYRGVEVLGVSPEEVHGVLIPIRLMLERFAFSKALEVMTPADLEAIAEQLDVMSAAAAAGDVDAVVDADIAFHEAVLQVVPQFHTVQIWHGIAPRIRVYFRRESLARDLDSVVDEHRALLEALRGGDRKTVLETLGQHIKRVQTEGEPRP